MALLLGSANALGSTGEISFGGGTLRFSASNTTDYSARFSTAANQAYRLDTNGQNVEQIAADLTSPGGTLTKLGTGTLTLRGGNSFTGGTAINGGVLALGSGNAIGSSGTISFGGGTLRFFSVSALDFSSRFSNAANQAYSLDTNGQQVTLASNLTSPGGSLGKLGAGTLTLSGSNSFSGTTRVAAGVLSLANTEALAGSTLDLNAADSGTVTFSVPGTNTYMLGGLSGSRPLALGATSLSIGANDASTAYAGSLSGVGALTKLGSGTLTLSGSNSYTGDTRVTAGTLALGNTAALAGSTLVLNATDAGSLAFTLSGANTYAIGGLTGSRDIVMSGSVGLSIGANGQSTTYAGVLSGPGALDESRSWYAHARGFELLHRRHDDLLGHARHRRGRHDRLDHGKRGQ